MPYNPDAPTIADANGRLMAAASEMLMDLALFARKQKHKENPMTLGEAVRAVLAKHPDLADEAIIERYPVRRYPGEVDVQGGIFAYQFMNADGRNIATYIPDIAAVSDSGGLQFQPGGDGHGRLYDSRLIRETEDIGRFKLAGAPQDDTPGM